MITRYFSSISSYFPWIFMILMWILLIPNIVLQIIDLSNSKHSSRTAARIIIVILGILECFLGFIALISPRKSAYVVDSGFDYQNMKMRLYGYIRTQEIIPFAFILVGTILFSFVLLFRSTQHSCESFPLFFYITDVSCNPYHSLPIFPLDTGLILMMIPLLHSNLYKDKHKISTILSWSLTLFAMILSAILLKSKPAIMIICTYFFCSAYCISDNCHFDSYVMNITNKVEENIVSQREIEWQQKDRQTKELIGNVAHDLKTPLSSFMQGIDFIQDSIIEFEKKLDPEILKKSIYKEFFNEIRSLIKSMKNTNSFMLMEINRFVDFTKASKGLNLLPKIDTIDLLETISLPLTCMKNIQDRITISLLPITPEIYNFILTDKQWLQENLLCLLSNAVKYSTKGLVTIKVQLQKIPKTRGEERSMSNHHTPINSNHAMASNRNHNNNNEEKSNSTSFPRSLIEKAAAAATAAAASAVSPGDLISGGIKRSSFLFKLDWRESSKSTSQTFEDFLIFEVEDTGIGMSDEVMNQLFTPFKQAQRLAGGTGLGLYSLSKRIDALGGQYGVRKRDDGTEGSLFWFSIPYRPDRTVTELRFTSPLNSMLPSSSNNVSTGTKKSKDDSSLVSRSLLSRATSKNSLLSKNSNLSRQPSTKLLILKAGSIENNESTTTTTAAATTTNQQDSINSKQKLSLKKRLHILLIEDSPTIAKMTSMMLKKLGHKVTVADNGHIGLQMMISSQENYLQYKQNLANAAAVAAKAAPSNTNNLNNNNGNNDLKKDGKSIILKALSFNTNRFTSAGATNANNVNNTTSSTATNSTTATSNLSSSSSSSSSSSLLYDVVLMDFQMPIMDGFEATRRYREYERKLQEKGDLINRQLIIGLSATLDQDIINEGLQLGLDDYFIKPLSSEAFLLKMKSLSTM